MSVCAACKLAGRMKTAAIEENGGSIPDDLDVYVIDAQHAKCKGHEHCDCQHRTVNRTEETQTATVRSQSSRKKRKPKKKLRPVCEIPGCGCAGYAHP